MSRIKFQSLPHGWDVELRKEEDGRYSVRVRAPNGTKNAVLTIAGLFTGGLAWCAMGPSVHKTTYFHSRDSAYSLFNRIVVTSEKDKRR